MALRSIQSFAFFAKRKNSECRMSSMFRSSEKIFKKWSLKFLMFLWTNVDLQFLEMFGWDTSCNISNVPHDCPLFSEHEHVRGDTIDWSTEWRRKKEEKKRSVSKSNFDVVFLFSESEAAGGFKQLTGSCTARNPRQLSQLRRNISNHHVWQRMTTNSGIFSGFRFLASRDKF